VGTRAPILLVLDLVSVFTVSLFFFLREEVFKSDFMYF
jgi:hypothetical protein